MKCQITIEKNTNQNIIKQIPKPKKHLKFNNSSKILSLKNFDAPVIAGNLIICLEALVKSKLILFW